jgi:hypothetical protein
VAILKVQTPPYFWRNFRLEQVEKLPIRSNLFEVIEEIYIERRKRFARRWRASLNSTLPQSTLDFYLNVAKEAEHLVRTKIIGAELSKYADRNLRSSMKIFVESNPKVHDVLDLDVFSQITISLDVAPNLLLEGVGQATALSSNFYENSFHTIFHRPQQTGYLVFHEIVVGHLVNSIRNKNKISSLPNQSSQSKADYWSISSHALNELAQYLKLDEAKVLILHLESPSLVKKQLPIEIKQLFLSASHIMWYFDLLAQLYSQVSPNETLKQIYTQFLLKSLRRIKKDMALRLRPNAGEIIDDLLMKPIRCFSPNDNVRFDDSRIISLLHQLSEDVWS